MSYLASLGNIGLNGRISPLKVPVTMDRVGQPIILYKIVSPDMKYPLFVFFLQDSKGNVRKQTLNTTKEMTMQTALMMARSRSADAYDRDVVEMPQSEWSNYRRAKCDVQRYDSFNTSQVVRLEGNAKPFGFVQPGDTVISGKMVDNNGQFLVGIVKWVTNGMAQVHWNKYGNVTNMPVEYLRSVTNKQLYRYMISGDKPGYIGKYSPPWDMIERSIPGMKHMEKPDWTLLMNQGMRTSGKVPYNHNDVVAWQLEQRGYKRKEAIEPEKKIGDEYFKESPLRGQAPMFTSADNEVFERQPEDIKGVISKTQLNKGSRLIDRALHMFNKPAKSVKGHKEGYSSDMLGGEFL